MFIFSVGRQINGQAKMQRFWQTFMDGFVMCIRIFAVASVLEEVACATANPCSYQQMSDSGVCVCNSTYCDTFDVPSLDCGQFLLITSSKAGKRFDIINLSTFPNKSSSSSALPDRWIKVDANRRFQTIIGFGGALTDATSLLIDKMSLAMRHYAYTSYVSPELGAAYRLFRIPLGGSDFSEAPWTYQEEPIDDMQLANITELHPFDRRRIKQLREIIELIPTAASTMQLILCSWSPPLWMKTFARWHGFNTLKPEYYSVWALYHVRVLQLWRNAGISFWCVLTGNEPISGIVVPIMTLSWQFDKQKQWVNIHLKPMLREYGFNDTKVLGFDDVRSHLLAFCLAFERTTDGPFDSSTKHLDGIDMIGVHWYLDDLSGPNQLDFVSQKYQVPILYTESCVGGGFASPDLHRGPVLGSWPRASAYIQRIIRNFSHGITAFIDWNMILNRYGGPSYSGNVVDAPMIYDEQSAILYKQPIFYGIAHFSRFLHKNCTRIWSNLSWLSGINVDAIAFSCSTEPKQQVIILHNRSSAPERITIGADTSQTMTHSNLSHHHRRRRRQIDVVLDAFSINTLVYRNC